MQKQAKCLLSVSRPQWIKPNFLADFAELNYTKSNQEDLLALQCKVFFLKSFHQCGEAVQITNPPASSFCVCFEKCTEKWTCPLQPLRGRCGRLSHAHRDCLVIAQSYRPSQALTPLLLWARKCSLGNHCWCLMIFCASELVSYPRPFAFLSTLQLRALRVSWGSAITLTCPGHIS